MMGSFNNKKGMEAGFLVAIIITLASFLLIGGMVMKYMASAEDKEVEVLCRDSVAMRAQSVVNVGGWLAEAEIKPVPVMCKTIDKKIKGNREDIKRQIVDKIARCWWMFGEGRYEEILTGSKLKLLPSVFGFGDLKNKCFNCYTLMIDTDIEGGPIGSDELNEFFANEKYHKSNTTYMYYIQSYGGPGRLVLAIPGIVPRQAYSISMMPKNKEVGEESVGKIVVRTVIMGVAASLATEYMNVMSNMFSEREVSSIYVSPPEVAQQQCGSGDLAGR